MEYLNLGGYIVSKRIAFILIFLLTLIVSGTALAAKDPDEITYPGKVLEVSSAQLDEPYQANWSAQLVTIRLLSGPYKNDTITLVNSLTGHPYYDIIVKKGDRVLVEGDFGEESGEFFIADYSRSAPLGLVTLLFIVLVILIGGRQGVKAILSLIGMGVVILTMILPLVLKGYNPIVVTVGLASFLTVLFIVFVAGYSKKTIAAICGTVGGLVASGLLALVIGKSSNLSGLASEEAQLLRHMGFFINYQGLLFSGMIIGALGAILDVGISIASAMEQIKEADPTTDFRTLFTRGILIGRDLIATMSNTLILAYVGSSLPLLLLFQAGDRTWTEVLNLDLVASEIVRAMTGSIGLTLAIPITALVSALLFIKPENKRTKN